jgi:transcriptional regulator with XRE-family HTH domain
MFNWLFESLSIGFFESLMDANFNIHLGKKLRMRRLSLGLTQTKVANAINVTFQQIQKYEKGTNGVSSSRLMQLSSFLKVPITYFYEDYVDSKIDSTDLVEDLNYSFLIKTFGKLSESQKLKIIQILKNTGSLKETG